MYNRQLHKFADSVADVTDKALDHGKNILYFTRTKANSAAKSVPVKYLVASLPALRSNLRSARSNAVKNFSHIREHLGSDLTRVESLALKITGIYLLIKWFEHNDKDLSSRAESVKAHIVEKPLTSAFIAISLGYMFGKLRK